MKVYIGSDHAGFALTQQLLKSLRVTVINLTPEYVDGDDYPDVAETVARKVAKEKAMGILVCGSAEGMCIAANKIKGIRAVVGFNEATAFLSRKHNDANVLCLPGGLFSDEAARKLMKPLPVITAAGIIQTWLDTPFSGEERHARRIKKIAALEK